MCLSTCLDLVLTITHLLNPRRIMLLSLTESIDRSHMVFSECHYSTLRLRELLILYFHAHPFRHLGLFHWQSRLPRE